MLWIIVGGTLLVFFYLLIFSLCIMAGQADRAIEFGRLHKNGSTEPEKAGSLVGSAFQVSVPHVTIWI